MPSWPSKASVMILFFPEVCRRAWVRVDILVGLQLLFSYAAVEEDCTSGLVIEVFDDSEKVGADVALLHGCQQSCMPNPVESHRHGRGLAGAGDTLHGVFLG